MIFTLPSLLLLIITLLLGIGVGWFWAKQRHGAREILPPGRKTLFAMLEQAVVVTDAELNILDLNTAATILFALSLEHARGQSLAKLLGTTLDMDTIAQSMSKTMLELTVGDESAQTTLQLQIMPLPQRKDSTAQWLFVIYDLMAQKHLEDALAQTTQALDKSRKIGATLNALIRYQVRKPMLHLLQQFEQLLTTHLPKQQEAHAHTLLKNYSTFLQSMDSILELGNFERGQLDLEMEPFILRECVEATLDDVAPLARAKGLELASLIDPDAPIGILADEQRLRHILTQLLTNAIEWTDHGEVVISIQATYKALRSNTPQLTQTSQAMALLPPYGHELHVIIRDTRTISPGEDVLQLFRPQQVDYRNLNLKIKISKRMIELLGGSMWLEFHPNQGTTLHFTLGVQADRGAPPSYLISMPAQFQGRRILVVDDHAASRHMLSTQLRSWGLEPTTVTSGEAALALLPQSKTFDLVLTDYDMPKLDGIAFAHALRQHPTAANLPIILMTAYDQQFSAIATRHISAIITKPIKLAQLHQALISSINTPNKTIVDTAELDRLLFDQQMAKRLPLRLLVVEDNQINQEVLVQMLLQLGYRAQVAADGVEALAKLHQQPFDVVLMDVQMPNMDGLEASRRLRNDPSIQQPQIIAVTANIVPEEREDCFKAGMDDYICKPIEPSELIAALERAANNIKQGVSTPPNTSPIEEAKAMPNDVAIPQSTITLDSYALQRLYSSLGPQAHTMLPNLLTSFVENANQLYRTFANLKTHEDLVTFHRAAHTLKSNSELFGALELAKLCRQLEHNAKAGDLADAETLVTQIRELFDQTIIALHNIVNEEQPISMLESRPVKEP